MKNRKLATRQLRVKKDTEKVLKEIEEAKAAKAAAKPPRIDKSEPDVLAEFKKLVAGTYYKGRPT